MLIRYGVKADPVEFRVTSKLLQQKPFRPDLNITWRHIACWQEFS
jgi:hypothetical protein